MIVPMLKLTLLIPSGERTALLEGLQRLGCVEIESSEERDAATVAAAHARSVRYDRARKALKFVLRDFSGDARSASGLRFPDDPDESLELLEKRLSEHGKARAEAAALAREVETWTPWGDFDLAHLAALRDRGYAARLLVAAARRRDEILADLAGRSAAAVQVGELPGRLLLLVLNLEGDLPAGAEEQPLPRKRLSELRSDLASAEARERELFAELAALSSDDTVLARGWERAENEGRLAAASQDLTPELSGRLVSMRGWFPAADRKAVEELLGGLGCWWEIREPAADEEPPVRLKNGAVTRLFEPVACLHSLPSYRELDPVPFFSMFFAFFVGCCLADAAYGAIVLVLALAARALVGRQVKPLMTLLAILGGVTVLCGVMLNSFFGESRDLASWMTPLAPYADEGGTVYPMMSLALVVGFVQILLAMGLRAYVSAREKGWKHGMEPVGFMLLTVGLLVWSANASAEAGALLGLKIHEFGVNGLPIGGFLASVPKEAGLALLGAGTLCLFLFANIGAGPAMRYSVLFLWSMYNYATKIVSDALSYLRVFALGLAGGLLAASFNKIAFMLVEHDGVRDYASPLVLGTVLILVVGHALNLVLSLVSAFVHPLRLTFVEFYTNLDYQGGGRPFKPLARAESQDR